MAEEDGGHGVVADPVHAGLAIDLRGVVGGKEAVAVEAARGHEDEDAEGGIGEAEALGRGFGEEADDEVDRVDVVGVDAADLLAPLGVFGELFKGADGLEVEELAKFGVAGDPELAAAHDVVRGEVDVDAVRADEVLEGVGVVVELDGAGVHEAERVEKVGRSGRRRRPPGRRCPRSPETRGSGSRDRPRVTRG